MKVFYALDDGIPIPCETGEGLDTVASLQNAVVHLNQFSCVPEAIIVYEPGTDRVMDSEEKMPDDTSPENFLQVQAPEKVNPSRRLSTTVIQHQPRNFHQQNHRRNSLPMLVESKGTELPDYLKIKCYVKYGNQTLQIKMDPDEPCLRLKVLLEESTGVPVANQHFYYCGNPRPFQNDKTLRYYGCQGGGFFELKRGPPADTGINPRRATCVAQAPPMQLERRASMVTTQKEKEMRRLMEEAAKQAAEEEAAAEAARQEEERLAREAAEKEEQERLAREAAEEEARRQAEEAERLAREAEQLRLEREAEEARKKAEEEAQRAAEEEARRKAEEEEEARRQAEEEEAARKKAEEEWMARVLAEQKRAEAAKKKAEEEAKRKAEEEARKRAEEQARRKAEEEARLEAERRAAEEAARKAAEEEAARKAAEEEARRKAEEEARLEAERQAEEEAARKKAEQKRAEEEKRAKEAAEREAAEQKALEKYQKGPDPPINLNGPGLIPMPKKLPPPIRPSTITGPGLIGMPDKIKAPPRFNNEDAARSAQNANPEDAGDSAWNRNKNAENLPGPGPAGVLDGPGNIGMPKLYKQPREGLPMDDGSEADWDRNRSAPMDDSSRMDDSSKRERRKSKKDKLKKMKKKDDDGALGWPSRQYKYDFTPVPMDMSRQRVWYQLEGDFVPYYIKFNGWEKTNDLKRHILNTRRQGRNAILLEGIDESDLSPLRLYPPGVDEQSDDYLKPEDSLGIPTSEAYPILVIVGEYKGLGREKTPLTGRREEVANLWKKPVEAK